MKQGDKISFYGKTDVGCVRTNNEDAFIAQNIWNEQNVLAVAIDGVGGYDGGEVAAAIAQTKIPEYLSASSNGERVELLKQAVVYANNAIFNDRANGHPQMSCVLTAVVVDIVRHEISMAHVGDSRLYSFCNGILQKLSHDHSLVGYREDIGELTEYEAMHHPQRNVISRDVGSEIHSVDDNDFIEAAVFPLVSGMTLLLCSDGLTDLVTSAEIVKILSKDISLERKASMLIEAAKSKGGKDNITVVLVDYVGEVEKMAEPDEIEVRNPDNYSKSVEDRIKNVDSTTVSCSNEEKCATKKHCCKRIVVIVAVILLMGLSFAFGYYFDRIFQRNTEKQEPLTEEVQPQEQEEEECCCGCMYCEFCRYYYASYSSNNDTVKEE